MLPDGIERCQGAWPLVKKPLSLQQEAVGSTAPAGIFRRAVGERDEQRVFSVGTRTPKPSPSRRAYLCPASSYFFS